MNTHSTDFPNTDHATVTVEEVELVQQAVKSMGKFPHQSHPGLFQLFPRWWRLVKIWFCGEEKWRARGFAVAVLVLALVNTAFYVRISYAQKNFSTALSGKDVAGFHKAVADFVVLICVAAPLFSFNSWVEDRLVLAWRAHLTRVFLRAYFKDNAYFRIRQHADTRSGADGLFAYVGDGGLAGSTSGAGSSPAVIDNPDQRICDDIGTFVRSSTSVSLSLFKKVCNCVAFASVLWGISKEMVVFMFAYAILGTLLTTTIFGRVLMSLYYQLLSREGDLRFSLVRVRECAESIAFYRGEAAEAHVVGGRLGAVITTTRNRIKWAALYDLWTSIYNYATILAPSLLTAPRYFRGEVEFGVISQASYAFSTIESALSIIINNLAQITGLAAETERLDVLLAAMTAHHDQDDQGSVGGGGDGVHITRVVKPGLEGLLLEGVRVELPGEQRVVCQGLDLLVRPGESVLVVGPSGCGKSSLLRALAGLWRRGRGAVHLPASTFFLPQKPFMPLGTLRSQLTFPACPGYGSDDVGGGDGRGEGEQEMQPLMGQGVAPRRQAARDNVGGDVVSDTELLSLLRDVRLEDLADKVGGLDAELDWAHVLSAGEQQRVAFLRLLLNTPHLAFLDEATSAIDASTEAVLYQLLRERCRCFVSVGHRMQLLRYHTHVLECKPAEGLHGVPVWTKCTSAEYQAKLQAQTGLTI